jgi:indolepyruvate ferredoxin oxidoreductase beta subunit
MMDKVARYMSADDVKARLLQVTDKVSLIDALGTARRAGNALTENIVMLGALSTVEAFPVPEDALRRSVEDNVPKKAVEVNLRAFDLGKETAYSHLCNLVKCRK